MSFVSRIRMIIIHGGKNEMKSEFYNDIFMLDLRSVDWIHPLFKDDVPLKWAKQKSIVISDRLFILGGNAADKFLNFDDKVEFFWKWWIKYLYITWYKYKLFCICKELLTSFFFNNTKIN